MCGQWQLNRPRLPALSNSSTTSPTTPQFLPTKGKTPGPLSDIKLIINTSSPLPKRTKIKINQGQGDEKQRSTSPCVNEAEAQVDDSHLRHNACAPPRQGRAHEVLPLSGASLSCVSNICTFDSPGEGFSPRAVSGYLRDLLIRIPLLLQPCSAGTAPAATV